MRHLISHRLPRRQFGCVIFIFTFYTASIGKRDPGQSFTSFIVCLHSSCANRPVLISFHSPHPPGSMRASGRGTGCRGQLLHVASKTHLPHLSAFILHHFIQTLVHSSLLSFLTPPHLCQLLTEGAQGQLPRRLLQQHTQVCVGIPAPSPSLLFSHTVGRGEKIEHLQRSCSQPNGTLIPPGTHQGTGELIKHTDS